MMKCTSRNLVAVAIVAIAALVFLQTGCTREEEALEPSQPAESESVEAAKQRPSRLDDPAYIQSLEERRDARKELLAMRNKLVAQMEAKIAEAKTRLGTEDEAVLKVELEKDPEWNSLYDRVVDLNKALDDERKRASAIVRERIMADAQKEKESAAK